MVVTQKIINFILNIFGYAYLWIEQYAKYPDDRNILGMDIIEPSKNQLYFLIYENGYVEKKVKL